jgi:hypothetical protein
LTSSIRTLCLLALAAGAGCAPAAPTVGTPVSPGVARALFETRTRHSDLVRVHVWFPADDSGHAAAQLTPAVVFIQGGFVDVERYAWQAEALAQKGFTVAMPEHALQLAFFEIENGHAAVELLREGPKGSLLEGLVAPSHIAAAGHSLGGVVAVKVALAGDVSAVMLEASYPDSADDDAVRGWSQPSLSVAGRSDCSASLDKTTAGAQVLSSPTAFVALDGVTHYQFTDSDQEDRSSGCTPGLSLDEAHRRIEQVLTTFLDGATSGGTAASDLELIAGTQVTSR